MAQHILENLLATFRERLLSKTAINFETGCWEWTASKNQYGYGQFYAGGTSLRAHRAVFELIERPIPDGLELDHLCRNRGCVNPAHLEPVTHTENLHRAIPTRTHCAKGHAYVGDNLRVRPNGWQRCAECSRQWANATREKRRASAIEGAR